jgi:hypothetical protein
MLRRLLAPVVMAVFVAVGWAQTVRADQAVLLDFVPPIAPGETAEWSFTLAVAGAGIPNVAYENAESFAVGETVTATIAPVIEPEGFGTVELLSEDTLTGTTSDDWNTGEFGEIGEIEFAPGVTLRYTAPSIEQLGCDENPGETFYGHIGVLADFSGDAGTEAHVDPLLGGQGWVGAAVPVEISCPSADTGAPPAGPAEQTPPPTDTAPSSTSEREAPPLWLLLSIPVVAGLLATARSGIRGMRPR